MIHGPWYTTLFEFDDVMSKLIKGVDMTLHYSAVFHPGHRIWLHRWTEGDFVYEVATKDEKLSQAAYKTHEYNATFDWHQERNPHWGHYQETGGNMSELIQTKRDELLDELKAEFPHGHPEFLPMLLEKMKLHSDKNHDYARGGNPLGNFERVAQILALYPDLKLSDPVVVMLVYALKQVDATLWGLSQNITQKVEGPIERLGDVLVYSGIAICALKDKAKKRDYAQELRDTCEASGLDPDKYIRSTPQSAAKESVRPHTTLRGTPFNLPLISEMPVPDGVEPPLLAPEERRRHPFLGVRHPRAR